MFPDVPALLSFYKRHYLDTTHLMRPVSTSCWMTCLTSISPFQASRKLEKVRAIHNFDGSGDSDDLPFRKGEVLVVISKDEDQWWTARNSLGKTGSIPVNYVESVSLEFCPALRPQFKTRPVCS